jgi:hypothetical protein
MQKHADRLDKRPPILAGPPTQTVGGGGGGGGGGSLSSDPYGWPKMDPMAMYSYGATGGGGLLLEGDGRDIAAYSPPWPDLAPRTPSSSAFSPLQTVPSSSSTSSVGKPIEFETSHFPRQQGQVYELLSTWSANSLFIHLLNGGKLLFKNPSNLIMVQE